MSRHIFPLFLMLALAPVLSACSGLLESDKPPVQTWWLEPPVMMGAGQGDAKNFPVTVNVTAVPGLDTDRILTLSPDARLNHFAGEHWAEHTPDLLVSLVVRSLESTGAYSKVSARHSAASGACHLQLEVRRFHARLDSSDQATTVEVELAGQYLCDGQETEVRSAASIPVSGNQMPAIVGAFQRGISQVMQELYAQM